MSACPISNAKGIKLIHLNIRSLYRKIDQVSLLYSNADFLLLTETWLNEKYGDVCVNIQGMSIYRNDRCNALPEYFQNRRIPHRGGGVVIYVKNYWTPYVSLCTEATLITPDYECMGLHVRKPNNRKMFIMCIYRPPQGSVQKLIDFLKSICTLRDVIRSEVWILGDFNLNIMLRNSPDIVKMNRLLREIGLSQYIQEPTRLTSRGGTCIDWVITNSLYVCKYGVLNDLLSDHFPVYAIRKKERETVVKVKKKVRIYKNYDENNFKILFNEMDWDSFFICLDVDNLWEKMYTHIHNILEIICPYKHIYVRKERVPWFTNEIYECMKKRTHYVKLFSSTRNNDIFLLSKYFRNKCNTLIRDSKSDYIKTSLDANVLNPRKYWKILNSMLKTGKETTVDFEFINQDSKVSIPKEDTADFLNDYFANVGTRKAPNRNRYPDEHVQCDALHIGNVSEIEIKKLLVEIDVSKDSCVEGVRSGILKTAFISVPNAIVHLFNQSLSQGIFPRKWAIGYINILPKGGDKTIPSNWRPITQTCLPAKLLEKIVQKRLVLHLNRYQILN